MPLIKIRYNRYYLVLWHHRKIKRKKVGCATCYLYDNIIPSSKLYDDMEAINIGRTVSNMCNVNIIIISICAKTNGLYSYLLVRKDQRAGTPYVLRSNGYQTRK